MTQLSIQNQAEHAKAIDLNFAVKGDRVLVKRFDAPSMSRGGLHVPNSAKEKPSEGIVLGLGDREPEGGWPCQLHDHVFFGKYAGSEIEIDGELLVIIKAAEVLGVRTAEVTETQLPLSPLLTEEQAARAAFLADPDDYHYNG